MQGRQRDVYGEIPARLAAVQARQEERQVRQNLIKDAAKQILHLNVEEQRERTKQIEQEDLERREHEKLEEMKRLISYVREKKSKQWRVRDTEFDYQKSPEA